MLIKSNKNFRTRIFKSLLLILLVGMTPLVALWRQNLGQIRAGIIVEPLSITVFSILLITGFWLLISRSIDKTVLLSCLSFILFFSFGHIYNLLSGKSLFGISIGYAKLFFTYMLLFIIISILVLKINTTISIPYSSLIILVVILMGWSLLPIVEYQYKIIKPEPQGHEINPIIQNSGKPLRNIYFIILDSYGRQDVLQNVLGYDNSSFIVNLRDRGFYIPDCAFSNYDSTLPAISSILNYELLQNPDSSNTDFESADAGISKQIIDNNVRKYFNQLGYSFVTGRGYSSFNDIIDSDIYLNYLIDQNGQDNLAINKFNALYLNTTLVRVITEIYRSNPYKYSRLPYWLAFNREVDPYLKEASFWFYQNNYIFDSLEEIPKMQGVFLIYAHINAPHGPYVYRKDGSFRYPLDTDDEKVLYGDTITYLNKRILEVIDIILNTSKIPPIIIIQGDHNAHGLTFALDLHKILNAYYLPGNLITPPYATITPVNNFPLIIKNYFDPTFSLRPDTLYVKSLNDHESIPASCNLNP
jgi:hypothetical protein